MFKSVLVAAAIIIASPAIVFSQDFFWSFDSTSFENSTTQGPGTSGTVHIFVDASFGFCALDLNFTSSDPSVVLLTGGMATNPTFNIVGGTRFNSSVVRIDPAATGTDDNGNLFAVNVAENGVNPLISALFDPDFDANVGPNGAVLLASVDYSVVGPGTATLEFSLGPQGVTIPLGISLNPSFGSATVTVVPATVTVVPATTLLGDINLDGAVDFLDIIPFIAILSSQSFQEEADLDENGEVNFLDLIPFVDILRSS